MSTNPDPRHVDLASLAELQEELQGRQPLQSFTRLVADLAAPAQSSVNWSVRGERRATSDGVWRPALHLQASVLLPLRCQRCLDPVEIPVRVDNHLILVADEDLAARLDEDSEDDVLATQAALDLHELLEDELILAQPLVPCHEACAAPVFGKPGEDAGDPIPERPHPFAVLAQLKTRGEK